MPSPIAAIDLITTAMRRGGILASGETPTADEANDGLQAFNDVLETWSTENLAVYGSLNQAFATVAGQASYTIGPGGNWNTDRPVTINGGFTTVQGVNFPFEMWTQAEYNSVGIPSQQQQIVERAVFINSAPLATVLLYPTPSAAVPIILDAPRILTQITTLSTSVILPPGYARALQFAIAEELRSDYGSPIDLSAQARATMAKIKRANRTPRISGFDSTIIGPGFALWQRGY